MPLGFPSSHRMVNPRTLDSFFIRSNMRASASMVVDRESRSVELLFDEAGVVMAFSSKLPVMGGRIFSGV